MAQHRLQRPDQARLEEFRKLRANSGSPEGSSKEERRRESEDQEARETESPEGSIEVDDRNDQDTKSRARSEESLPEQESPRISPVRSDQDDNTYKDLADREASIRLRPSLENLNESEVHDQDQTNVSCCGDLSVKIRVEGTVDLSTKRGQDKENMGQDLTTRRKEDDMETEREPIRSRRDRSPKPRQVWRPY